MFPWMLCFPFLFFSLADSVDGPYYLVTLPVLEDLTCNTTYCIGQPSALIYNGQVVLYYSRISPSDVTPPNEGVVLAAVSDDGIAFSPFGDEGVPLYTQRDVDVKYDMTTQQFLMVQGDVGRSALACSSCPMSIPS